MEPPSCYSVAEVMISSSSRKEVLRIFLCWGEKLEILDWELRSP